MRLKSIIYSLIIFFLSKADKRFAEFISAEEKENQIQLQTTILLLRVPTHTTILNPLLTQLHQKRDGKKTTTPSTRGKKKQLDHRSNSFHHPPQHKNSMMLAIGGI
jgi:hypothetical protein